MRSFLSLSTILIGLLAATVCQAEDKACRVKTNTTFFGQTISMDRCMEYQIDLSKEDLNEFFKSCSAMANVGSKTEVPGRAVRMASCPQADVSAVCRGLRGMPINTYHYAESESELKAESKRCTSFGGKWTQIHIGK